jgi:hypothetical protein
VPAARKQPEPITEPAAEADAPEVEETEVPEEVEEAYYAPIFRACDPSWTPESPAWRYLVTTDDSGRIVRVSFANGQEG